MEQNYLPLFRKYRPQSFKDVVGQESLVKALSNAIELGRIANAYLFCGPRGTGKTSTARIFAKSLNCANGSTLEPCQTCPSCVDITNATGLDVIEIDAASNRGVQDAKDLISQVQYAPINGKYKIFIIDEVHMLSNEAFNALLKTFEEPPKNVIFILATTEPHKVLETIVSRCQRFDLRRISTDDIIQRLRKIADLENIKITDDALFTIAKNVSGGLRDSLALLDQVSILGAKEEIQKELIEYLLGKVNFDISLNLLKNLVSSNVEKSINAINDIYSKGNEPRNLAENFIEFLRNVILVLNSADTSAISNYTTLIKDDIEKIIACNFDKKQIVKILNTIIEYYKEIKVSTNPYLWMELAAVAACNLDLQIINNQQKVQTQVQPQTTPVNNVVMQKLYAPIEQTQNAPVQNVQVQAPTPIEQKQEVMQTETQQIEQVSQAVEVYPEPIQNVAPVIPGVSVPQQNMQVPESIAKNQDSAQIWANIIAAIPSLPTRAFYSGVAKLVKVENKKITLGFLHENTLLQAKSELKIKQLVSAIESTYQGYEYELIRIDATTKVVEVKPKLAQRPTAPQPTPRQDVSLPAQNPIKQETIQENAPQQESQEKTEEQKRIIKNYSPKVQDMIEQFSGRIID